MTTIKQEWERYHKDCYPEGTVESQKDQLIQAFYAGAIVMFKHCYHVSDLPEEEAVKRLDNLEKEVTGWCEARCASLNQGRN